MIIFWREESSMNDEVCISIYMPPPCCPRFIYAQKKRLKAASAWAATVPLSFAFFVCSSPIGLCAAEQYKSHMHNLTRAHIMMFFYFLFFAFFFSLRIISPSRKCDLYCSASSSFPKWERKKGFGGSPSGKKMCASSPWFCLYIFLNNRFNFHCTPNRPVWLNEWPRQ